MTIVEFLLERIAEDEAIAKAATQGNWEWEPPTGEDWPSSDQSLTAGDESVLYGWGYDASGIEGRDEDRVHIARWQPSRVLAECAAKRRIVEHYRDELIGDENVIAIAEFAAIYADHPEFDPAWRA